MPKRRTKVCKGCGERKSLDDFYVNRAMKDGRMSICIPCSSVKSAAYYQANLERQRTLGREKARRMRKTDPEGMRRKQWESRIKKKYGISVAEYYELLRVQNGCCAICGDEQPGWPSVSGVFLVDHNHETGVVRGLLCSRCNQGLGYFKDDPDRLERAAAYLRLPRDAGKEVMADGD